MLTEGGPTMQGRLDHGYLLALSRPSRPEERQILQGLLEEARGRFQKDPEAAKKLLAVGASPRDPALNDIDLAAWTTVASTLLNLDETISRR
jgi:hypothetical protein